MGADLFDSPAGNEKSSNTTELQDLGAGSGSEGVVAAVAEQYGQDASGLYKQTRTRRLFSTAQLFAFALVFQGAWKATAGNSYFALLNGGHAGWLFGYIVTCIGVLAQVASFCEMASVLPIAGAQYYWTYYLAPPKSKLLLTWLQGWATWLGGVAGLAGYINSCTLNIAGVISVAHPDFSWDGWRITLMILGLLTLITLINLYGFRIVPWFELLVGILNIVMFFVLLVVLWTLSPRNDASQFLDTTDGGSGWDSYFVRFNVGNLSAIWLFIGFEGVIHMGEETRNPRKAVPRAVFWSMLSNMCMGLIMIFTFGMAMPEMKVMLNAVYPTPTILLNGTGSKAATIVLASCLSINTFAGIVASLSSVSRLTWAWARDGGLPKYFAFVDGKTRVPFRAVLFTTAIVGLLALLNLSDESYVAFGALTALCCLAQFASYAGAIACILYARHTGAFQQGIWNLGKAGYAINVFAIVYTVFEMIWLPFPTILPVTAKNMNYAGPVFGAVILGAMIHWLVWAGKNWQGPNRAVVDIVLHLDEASRVKK